MKAIEFLTESPERELAKKLPTLAKHDYNTIDRLMQKIAKKHKITGKKLHDRFLKKYHKIPDDWIKEKISETQVDDEIRNEVDKFADWACKILKVERKPKIILSMDTEEAQTHHHTGKHIHGDDKVWVYARNRNLVDILRTVFHEIVHVRQGERGEIGPNASYPGSPIEVEADALAGKYIKIYGERNHHIFQ
jgi:hypothetical protein